MSKKKSNQRITLTTIAMSAGSIMLLFAASYLMLNLTAYGAIFLVALPTLLQGDTNLIWYCTSCALIVGFLVLLLIIVSKSVEYLTNVYHYYQNMRQERKRIERLITQTEAETVTETDTLDDLAEAESMNKEKYS